MQDAVVAIILYTWLLTISREASEAAYLQNNLGEAYRQLPTGDREANLRQAIACYEAALQVFQLAHIDYYASEENSNLELVRNELRSLQREEQDHKEVLDE